MEIPSISNFLSSDPLRHAKTYYLFPKYYYKHLNFAINMTNNIDLCELIKSVLIRKFFIFFF